MEYESKNLLTKLEYDTLCKYLNHTNIKPKVQINYYFETDNFALKKQGAALRIREKNGHYVLTLKQPYQDGLLETHNKITHDTLQLWLRNEITSIPNIDSKLNELSISRDKIKYGGQLLTERIEVNQFDALIVLDKSKYNHKIDYELEVEASSKEKAEQVLNQLLEMYQIEKKHTPNKIARFYQSLQ